MKLWAVIEDYSDSDAVLAVCDSEEAADAICLGLQPRPLHRNWHRNRDVCVVALDTNYLYLRGIAHYAWRVDS